SNGSYNVWLIVENTGSAYCIDSIEETINISNQDSLHASFTTTSYNDTVGQYLYNFVSTSTGVNGVTEYRWDAGDTTGADSGIGMTTYSHYYHYTGVHIATLSIWFTQYPGMPHHNASGINNRYDFSTYSMAIDVQPQGIATISNPNADLKLYPNPNNGAFKLSISGIDNMQNAELEITNLMGQVVYQTTAQSSNGMIQQNINLQNISSGTYFVRIITPTNVYNTKTVITR
ncbi:MAG TPA: T9SS type A sorting domain-containing protein, partial [Bacteroidia bacterium]|nr:T9SS type A sorting domain-containing protein [Bacteroidia bacterium]